MQKEANEIDKQALMKLQLLSEKISDLIHNRKFDKVAMYDIERKEIIKRINEKPSWETLEILKSISKKNKSDVLWLKKEQVKLSKTYNLSIKTFQAYSK